MTNANDAPKLTKAQILGGVIATEDIYVAALSGVVTIRPLTDGEWERVKAIRTRGLKMSMALDSDALAKAAASNLAPAEIARKAAADGAVDIDFEKVAEAEYEGDCLSTSLGLSVINLEHWSIAEVKGMPQGAPAEIAKHVYRLTGVDGGVIASVEAFQQNAGEQRDSGPAFDGVSTDGPPREFDPPSNALSVNGSAAGVTASGRE